jgi:hypothetical protein
MTKYKNWKKSDIEDLGIKDRDIEYLTISGIEIGNFGCVDIYPEFEFKKGIVLGYDNNVPIVCSENGDGVFLHEELVTRFVNNSVEQFILTIKRFKLYCSQVEDIFDEENALKIVNSAIKDMTNLDEFAWSKDANYWPIIGQQMIEGNL